MEPTEVFRAPMRGRDRDDVPPGVGAEYGISHGIVAIGPGEGAKAERMLDRFAALPDGVFVWTRDTAAAYHLGRIRGPLRHDDSAGAQAVGLPFARDAEWLDRPFAEPEAPEGVAYTFARGGKNFQRIHDAATERRTAEMWTTPIRPTPLPHHF